MSDAVTWLIRSRGEASMSQLDKASDGLVKEWEMEAQKELAEANLAAAKARGGKK